MTRQWKRVITVLVLVILSLSISLVSGCTRQLTAEQRLADFEYLFQVLSENHPYIALKARAEGYDWTAHKAEFAQWIAATKNDAEFAQAINKILMLINNGHTYINGKLYWTSAPTNRQAWGNETAKTTAEQAKRWSQLANPQPATSSQLPVQAVYSNGEYFVNWVSPEAPNQNIQLGATIKSVNGKPVHEYVASLRGQLYLLYDPARKHVYRSVFAPPASRQPLAITFTNPDGSTVDTSLGFTAQQPPRPVYPTNDSAQQGNVFTTTLADGQVGYVRVKQMVQGTDQALNAFIEQAKGLPALIIDIRGNSGGSDSFWSDHLVVPLGVRADKVSFLASARSGSFLKPFVTSTGLIFSPPSAVLSDKQLRNLPPELETSGYYGITVWERTPPPAAYDGKIFVLVDQGVYSSSESFAMFCKASGWATLVGGYTGGDGGGYDPALLVLPNSRMLINFPFTYGLNPDGTANEEYHTAPDVLVQQSTADMLKYWDALRQGVRFTAPDPEYDTVLRECLRLATGGSQGTR